MAYPLIIFATATYDELISTLVATGLLTFGLNAPRSYRVLTKVTTFTTTVRVIYRVHRRTANGRTNTTPTCSTCFTQNAKHVFSVTDFTGWHGNQLELYAFRRSADAELRRNHHEQRSERRHQRSEPSGRLYRFHFYVVNR